MASGLLMFDLVMEVSKHAPPYQLLMSRVGTEEDHPGAVESWQSTCRALPLCPGEWAGQAGQRGLLPPRRRGSHVGQGLEPGLAPSR